MKFTNLFEMINKIKTEQQAIKYFVKIRWNKQITCPHCNNLGAYNLKNEGKNFKCKSNKCNKLFSYKTGTIFENTKVSMRKWFLAIYLHKKGISSYQLMRDLKITQKTAWFMLHRIREVMKDLNINLEGVVEIDEAYLGGKAENMHMSKRIQARGIYKKVAVLGMIERNGKVKATKINDTKANTLKTEIYNTVKEHSLIITDELNAYKNISNSYNHQSVNHSAGEYVKEFVFENRKSGRQAYKIHTNNIENFWSHMKRGIYGIYHFITEKHSQAYIGEFQYRWNSKDSNEGERFDNVLLKSLNKRLTYSRLIA